MKTHGEAGKNQTKEHRAWRAMVNRCTNTKGKRYPEWGGRGIKVCERWISSYDNFIADMGRSPSPTHSIDRIENDKGYYKENCRWATPMEQSNNTRRNVMVKYDEEEKPLRTWCGQLNLNYKSIFLRLWSGWTPERAFNTPMTKRGDIHPTSLFTRNQVIVIKEAIEKGFSLISIASYFKTYLNNICRIKTGRTYKHIQP